jgi:hypothetical protein
MILRFMWGRSVSRYIIVSKVTEFALPHFGVLASYLRGDRLISMSSCRFCADGTREFGMSVPTEQGDAQNFETRTTIPVKKGCELQVLQNALRLGVIE